MILRGTFPATAAEQSSELVLLPKIPALKQAYRHPCERAMARRAKRQMITKQYEQLFDSRKESVASQTSTP